MRKAKKIHINHNYEFELDLAPLLAVMVKLVPVLLISSAFVQMMIVETELPQAVNEAIQQNEKDAKSVQMVLSNENGIKIMVIKGSNKQEEVIPLVDKKFDFNQLHMALIKLKTENPDIFRIELLPEQTVNYQDIIKAMDESRTSGKQQVRFPVFDKKENKQISTDYMFPDIVFANMLEG